MDKREFWATKPPLPTFETIAFAHPSFAATFRLVANVFAPVTLGGNVYTPAPMEIQPPAQTGDGQAVMSITFPRQVVGRQFKGQLRLIAAAGSRAPITITYARWLGETDAPKVTWVMYAAEAGGINFDAQGVTVRGTIDNPMRRDVSPVYLPDVFTGLELL